MIISRAAIHEKSSPIELRGSHHGHHVKMYLRTVLVTAWLAWSSVCLAADAVPGKLPPKTWVDKDTGHRIWNLVPDTQSTSLYFTKNAFSPDGNTMLFIAGDGIRLLDLPSRESRLLVAQADPKTILKPVEFGRKTKSVFFIAESEDGASRTLFSIDLETNNLNKLFKVPPRYNIESINSDETLAVGTFESEQTNSNDDRNPANQSGVKRGEVLYRRFSTSVPMTLFVVDLRTGNFRNILETTDWISHPQFSPRDPSLIMYCHEGPWQSVDRIWTIHADGSEKKLVHARTMSMEIAGHEFWDNDGKTIWYDWQIPKGRTFYLASVNTSTNEREAYNLERGEWSIHFNKAANVSIFAGDGADRAQVARSAEAAWIYAYRPESLKAPQTSPPPLIKGGILRSERLVNMAAHDYRLEPNIRITPDGSMVILRTNMFGKQNLFAVEISKSKDTDDTLSTPELAAQIRGRRRSILTE